MHESETLNAKCGLQIGYYYASDLVFMTSKNTKAIKREVVTKLFSSIFVHSFSQFGGVLF